ncbi:MAG: transcriptional regulator, TetR family [Actinomycetia bacterium]|nr:transcriptional regulator, TetR family [Actinomycetes bacterium]
MVRDTRQRILDAAAELFVERGYEATSLREIAERVGVTKAALYYHFPGKEDLLRALLEPLEEFQQRLLASMDGPLDRESWAAGSVESIDWLIDHGQLFQLLDHNRGAILALGAEESEDTHQQLHRRSEELLNDPAIPLEERVRYACALGVTFAVGGFSGSLAREDPDKVRAIVNDAVRKILELD